MPAEPKSLLRRALGRLRAGARALRNTSGNVAIITALLAPVLLAAAGFAIDFGYASYVHQKLDRAAEASVVGAVSQSAATAMGGYSNTNGLQQYGAGLFAANIAQLSIGTVTPNLTVVSNGKGGVVANVNYTASVATNFSGIIGIKTINVGGSAQATANPTTYINYYIIVDVSQSMGVGATPADMQNLFNRVLAYNNGPGPVGCVFGCHVAMVGQTYTNEYLAHNVSPQITLRIDAAVAAIQNIISDAAAAAGSNKNIKIGIYTMSNYPTSTVSTISAPSNDFTSLATLAATIDLGPNYSGGAGDTNFTTQLATFSTLVAANGSGASAVSPINYVFLITDGLTDYFGAGCTYGHCTSAISSSVCTSLKAKATVGVIYTTYNPIYNNNNPANGYEGTYSALVLPYASQLAPNLQNCATSSSYYFEASDGPGINTAMKTLFRSTQQSALLQQ